MPIDKEASAHGSKKPKTKQKRVTKRRSILPRELEDHAPTAYTD